MSRPPGDVADVVVVGSGPGGALTAATLAEHGALVVVCEEGEWVEHGTHAQFSLAQMAAQYRHAGLSATLGRTPIAYAEGRCAGGGSEINSGLYHRPPEPILDEWRRDYGAHDLTPESVYTHSERIERELSVGTRAGAVSPASRVLEDGARHLGWRVSEIPRWFAPRDAAHPGRQTMTRTYLARARRAGADVRTGVRADRVIVEGDRAVGVEIAATATGARSTIRGRSVVVAGGAIQTPAILLRSGVASGVGRTLRVHPTVKLAARFPFDVASDDVPVHQVKEFAPDLSLGGSSSSAGQVALTLADDWPGRRDEFGDPARMAVYYAAIRPEGRGRVRVLPGIADPLVTYSLTRRDMALLRRGLARLALLLLEAGAERVWPSVRNAPGASSRREIDSMAAPLRPGAASLMTIHLFSSVPMGERPDCPVDSYGRVKAVRSLYVNDASLLPNAPGVNPQGTIMALADRNVRRWLEEDLPSG